MRSFSPARTLQVEYTSSPLGLSRPRAFVSRAFCEDCDLLTSWAVKRFSTLGSAASSVPEPEQGASSRIWSKRKKSSSLRASTCITLTPPAPWRSRLKRSFSARGMCISQAVMWALPPESAAIWVVLPPGAAHMSSTSAPGRGARASAGSMEERLCT